MAKKKTFQEYTQEALLEIEKTEAALKQAKLEKEQAEHRIQRSLNYLDTQKKKKRKARTHLLIQKGAAIEAICKDTKYLTEEELEKPTEERPRKMQADRRSAPSPCLDWNCQKEMKAVRLQGSISLSRGNYRNG